MEFQINCWAEIIYLFFWIQETSLADLLQLNLHCFEEHVRGIVDKAVKEMRMEKVLSELNSTWTGKGVWPIKLLLQVGNNSYNNTAS